MAPSKKANFENFQKRALKIINGNRGSGKLERISSIRSKMCVLEVFKILNGLSPHAFHNYFMKVNRNHCTRANTKNVVLPKDRSESGKKAFSSRGAMIFHKMIDEMKSQASVLRLKTLCSNFNIDLAASGVASRYSSYPLNTLQFSEKNSALFIVTEVANVVVFQLFGPSKLQYKEHRSCEALREKRSSC